MIVHAPSVADAIETAVLTSRLTLLSTVTIAVPSRFGRLRPAQIELEVQRPLQHTVSLALCVLASHSTAHVSEMQPDLFSVQRLPSSAFLRRDTASES